VEPQDTYQGFSPSAYGTPAAYIPPSVPSAPVGGAAPQLRPLSTGEILDRTLAVFRRHFWLFTGIGAVPAVVLTLTSIARLIFLSLTHRSTTLTGASTPGALAEAMGTMMQMQLYFLPATVLFLVAYGISHAAVVDAVGMLTRGFTASSAESYRNVRGRWLRWTGIALRQFWSFLWPFTIGTVLLFAGAGATAALRGNAGAVGLLLLVAGGLAVAGLVLGIVNFIRHALATPAGVQEDLGVSAAMRRSRQLVAGRKGRIFLALLLVYVLQMVAGGIQLPFAMLASRARGAEHILLLAIELIVGFMAVSVVSPIASIALCLFYVDERVRREGYDIELLMQRSLVPAGNDSTEV
jgi:hypothetical protein